MGSGGIAFSATKPVPWPVRLRGSPDTRPNVTGPLRKGLLLMATSIIQPGYIPLFILTIWLACTECCIQIMMEEKGLAPDHLGRILVCSSLLQTYVGYIGVASEECFLTSTSNYFGFNMFLILNEQNITSLFLSQFFKTALQRLGF